LPTILVVAFCTVASARVIISSTATRVPAIAIAFGLAVFGSMLAFAPVPECHAAGGALLLLQASLMHRWLNARSAGEPPARHLSVKILIAGVAATGFTLSNLLPATIVAAPLLLVDRPSARAIVPAVIVVLGAGLLAMGFGVPLPNVVKGWIDYELEWTYVPTSRTLRESFTGLVTYQFGVPGAALRTWQNPLDATTVMSIGPRGPSPLHYLALLAWIAGLAVWWAGGLRTTAETRILVLTSIAGASLVAFHSIYGSYESYVVSPHVWPYIALPACFAVLSSRRLGRHLPLALLAAALALSLVQSSIGMRSLNRLPSQPGHLVSAGTTDR
jgi:hypothetical protein